jgi:tetratricopeptide (TPR) repeat protein
MMTEPTNFFVAGGTLDDAIPSYVTRPADETLFRRVQQDEFCYILTARQMGKSSLMIRTANQLRAADVTPIILDLTEIGVVSSDEWYLGLLTDITSQLDLDVEVEGWWHEHAHLGQSQRFGDFLRQVVLEETSGPLVIFIDEIDTTLKLPFRDDFFAAIRAIYNARPNDAAYTRLTFVLLGVATPTDLIADRSRTPFNIGQRVSLNEFSYPEAAVLRQGLDLRYPGQGDLILRRIFYWTNGHPYLTQKLCQAAVQHQHTTPWSEQDVDALVESTFFSEEGRKAAGMDNVQRALTANSEAEQRAMLALYRDIRRGKSVTSDDRSATHNHLELYGLVRMEQGKLYPRNRIYAHLFNEEWIASVEPPSTRRERRRAIAALSIAVLLLLLVPALLLMNPREPAHIQAQTAAELCDRAPEGPEGDGLRLECLAGMFAAAPGPFDVYDDRARERFYEFSSRQQRDVFINAPDGTREQVETIVRGIYVSLDTRTAEYSYDKRLMEAMLAGLGNQQGDATLRDEIEAWDEGRALALEGQYGQALVAYSEAISLNGDHPVMRYDRAIAYIELEEYRAALDDLNSVVEIAERAPPTPTPEPPTATDTQDTGATPTATIVLSATAQTEAAELDSIADADGASTERSASPEGSEAEDATTTPTIASSPDVAEPELRFISAEKIIETVENLFAQRVAVRDAWIAQQGDYPLLKVTVHIWGA